MNFQVNSQNQNWEIQLKKMLPLEHIKRNNECSIVNTELTSHETIID